MRKFLLFFVSFFIMAGTSAADWELTKSTDPISDKSSITLIAKYGKSGGLAFECLSPGNPKSKIVAAFISDEWLGEALHLTMLYVRFDSDPAWEMVGNYPGKYVAFFLGNRKSVEALNRAQTASKVHIRAFRFDGAPIDADITLSNGEEKISLFKKACFGNK